MPSLSSPGAGPSQPLRTTKETHPNLPPGLILGPDGKPCKVCNSWQDWAKLSVKKKAPDAPSIHPQSTSSSSSQRATAGGMGAFAGIMGGSIGSSASKKADNTTSYPSSSSSQQPDRSDCPADTALLGRSTWTFLHTTAAYYPISAPPRTQENMRRLLSSLSVLYPCVPCAEDFQENVKAHPPDVSGREGLSRWLCERHNEVNDKLGKVKFDCSWTNLDSRWKDGPKDGNCD
jgi:FAD-linked sulfhydryl oxidase